MYLALFILFIYLFIKINNMFMILFKNDFINNKYLILKKQIQIILTFRS